MKDALRLVPQLALAVVVLVVLLATSALPTSRALAIWVVMLTAIGLRELVFRFRENAKPGHARRFDQAFGARPAKPRNASPFVALEQELELSIKTAGHAHRRLIPLLRMAAAARLASRHGVELERRPDVARRLLGEEAWAFLRPDRPEPADRHAPGPRPAEVAAVIGRIEAL